MNKQAKKISPIQAINAQDAITRLQDAEAQMNAAFISRSKAIRSLFLGLIAEENVLLIGPPGEGKSALVRAFCGMLSGSHFEYLLTRFTEPNELTGPKSITALTEGRTEFLTAGHLPEASSAFLDEIFKCNSATLNALLTLINERKFKVNPALPAVDVPLQMVIGASNELPEDEAAAFFDRFTLRHVVGRLKGEEALMSLLNIQGNPEDSISLRITEGELEAIRALRKSLEIPADVKVKFVKLINALREAGLDVSSRTMRKVLKLAQASALMNGSLKVRAEDFDFAGACFWQKTEQEGTAQAIVSREMNPLATDLQILRDAIQSGFDPVRDLQAKITAGEKVTRSALTIAVRTFQDETCDKIRTELFQLEELHGSTSGVDSLHDQLDELFEVADELMRTSRRGRKDAAKALTELTDEG